MEHAANVRLALDFMERNLREPIRVEDVAQAAHFSPSQFHAVFLRAVGRTPADHLRRRRLSCAALDLALSCRRILDIAVEYRFESQEAFGRAFKRVYGITPGLFRCHRAPSHARPLLGLYSPADPLQKGGPTVNAVNSADDRAARHVLPDVMKVGFELGPERCPENVPFPSCLAACVRYLGEQYPWLPLAAHNRTWRLNFANVHILASSGMAFSLLWRDGWHPDNADLMFVADPREIIDRAFASVGYSYEIVEKTGAPDDEERYRQRIIGSIQAGHPVLAFGVIGPPECCIITGYDDGGSVLIGWNFFQNDPAHNAGVTFEPNGCFRKADWFPHTQSIILIGQKTGDENLALRDTLRWALSVARTREVFGRHAGFAAFEAWLAHLLDDRHFATPDREVLRQRHEVHMIASLNLAECRAWASQFLHHVANTAPAMAEDLQAAADCYSTEHDLMWKMWALQGGLGAPEGPVTFTRPEVRQQSAAIIREALTLDRQAAEHIERALAR